jgi:hypothetical protein
MRRSSTRLAISPTSVWPAARWACACGKKSGDYKLADFRSRAGDGWHHSSWDERTPIHVGENKVHLKVKFSRWRKDGSLICAFETIYIVTRLEGRWGIQARSSFAS